MASRAPLAQLGRVSGALAAAALLTSSTCHFSVHSDPDGCDPKHRVCPPSQPAHSGGAPELPQEAYRILEGTFATLPGALDWEGWILEGIEGPPPLGPWSASDPRGAHGLFAKRLAAANPALLRPFNLLQGYGDAEWGSWSLLGDAGSRSSVLLAFDAEGRLRRIEWASAR